MRARLYRTRSPWLLVLDNMSSSALMSSSEKGVLPRGCVSVGHVLVTSRMATLSPERGTHIPQWVAQFDFGRQIGIVAACWLPVLDLRRRLAASQKSDLSRDAGLNQSLE